MASDGSYRFVAEVTFRQAILPKEAKQEFSRTTIDGCFYDITLLNNNIFKNSNCSKTKCFCNK